MKQFCLLISSLLIPSGALGAACCGGGFAAPALIAGDEKAQLTASYGNSQTVRDVGTDSLWRRRNSKETTATYKLEGAHVFLDRWQAGLSLPLVQRSRSEASAFGLGDISTTLGYEALPDWDYSPWRPKGLVFLQITAPTGRSANESTALFQLDSRGRGFWAVGAGYLLTKPIGAWDFFATSNFHRSLSKGYSNESSSGQLRPGWGGEAGFGTGFNFQNVRFGASLIWNYEDPVDVAGTASSSGVPQRFATASLSVSHLASTTWAGTLSIADQTLFGAPLNTSLGRGASLSLQRRWER